MKQLEIMFSDLNYEAQNEVLDFYGVNSPDDLNADITPLAILDFEEEEKDG